MAYEDNAAYFRRMAPYAQQANAATGLPVSVILSQWGLESGYGTSELARNANNHGGIKYVGQSAASGNYNGYAQYSSLDAFVSDYSRVINLDYLAHLRQASTPEDAMREFTVADPTTGYKYAEDERYSDKLLAVYRTYGLSGYDGWAGPVSTDGILQSIKGSVSSMDAAELSKYAAVGLAAVALMALIRE